VGVDAARSPELARVFDGTPPFLSLYLATPGDVDRAAGRNRVRWDSLRRTVEQAGAPAAVLDAVDGLVPEAHHLGATLAVIADAGGVRHVAHHPEPPATDRWHVGALPALGPLLGWEHEAIPYLVVLVDRAGADIVSGVGPAVAGQPAADAVTVGAADHSDPELRKSAPGGWSQRRYQQRAENLWKANAADVAERLTALVDELRPRVVAVAGDVRAVQLLGEALPERARDLVRIVEGSRAPGGSDHVGEEIERIVATEVAGDTVDLVRLLREEAAHDLGVTGVRDTVAALAAARVASLLVHDDPDDGRTAWFGATPNTIGLDAAAVTDMGEAEPRSGRLVDVVVRAALGTGAEVRVTPTLAALPDGVGALLRY
jgi:hypothetical protein